MGVIPFYDKVTNKKYPVKFEEKRGEVFICMFDACEAIGIERIEIPTKYEKMCIRNREVLIQFFYEISEAAGVSQSDLQLVKKMCDFVRKNLEEEFWLKSINEKSFALSRITDKEKAKLEAHILAKFLEFIYQF